MKKKQRHHSLRFFWQNFELWVNQDSVSVTASKLTTIRVKILNIKAAAPLCIRRSVLDLQIKVFWTELVDQIIGNVFIVFTFLKVQPLLHNLFFLSWNPVSLAQYIAQKRDWIPRARLDPKTETGCQERDWIPRAGLDPMQQLGLPRAVTRHLSCVTSRLLKQFSLRFCPVRCLEVERKWYTIVEKQSYFFVLLTYMHFHALFCMVSQHGAGS